MFAWDRNWKNSKEIIYKNYYIQLRNTYKFLPTKLEDFKETFWKDKVFNRLYTIYNNIAFIDETLYSYFIALNKINKDWYDSIRYIRKKIKTNKEYYWWLLVKYYLYKIWAENNLTEIDKKIFNINNKNNELYIDKIYKMMLDNDLLDDFSFNIKEWEKNTYELYNINNVYNVIKYLLRLDKIKEFIEKNNIKLGILKLEGIKDEKLRNKYKKYLDDKINLIKWYEEELFKFNELRKYFWNNTENT